MGDTKNIVLFAAISIAVFFGYNALFISPQQEALQREAVQQQAAAQLEDGLAPKEAAPADMDGPDSNAVAQSSEDNSDIGHVKIVTPELSGSLSLRGARFDDLLLVNHKVSMEDDAADVRLLRKAGSADAYYARFGWAASRQENGFVPGPRSAWTADSDILTPDQPVTLAWDNGDGVRFLMKVEVDEKFMFTVSQTVINSTDETLQVAPYGMISRRGEPKTDGLYILHEGAIGVFNGTLTEKTYSNLEDDGKFEATGSTGGWMGITDKYWMATLIPDQQAELSRARMMKNNGGYRVDYVENWQPLAAGDTLESTSRFYAGAKIVSTIDDYADTYNITLFDRAIDWGWFDFLTRPIFTGLHWLFNVTGNYGVAILAMTVILKLILFPLANKSYRSMSHMKDAQPKIKALQERYKDDKQRLQQEMMALYKKEKINPMAGCLPMIPQIFIFFALYKTLYVTIEMRHQPFFGWITDLSARDTLTPVNLFGLIPWDPPAMIAIGVLPILMGITMWLQQKLNPQTSMDPTQQKVMSFLPIIFTFIMAGFSSGLVLYWTWNNLLSIAQQSFIMKREHARREALGKA
ncbi:membrane protein insertase YidC [Kordiimonas lacus]|uniref:Membrane protein insertase YidC n=1 Tax=Kordiimonas lacus TaxID=637679 RepID=A0A1G7EDB7_9PROT|nr:membrane protein insertase YidC [Kordiimonas lacus]SDE61684.1 YidC/Oxa1 family membrane protein insertase [Kordiimonas lacus]